MSGIPKGYKKTEVGIIPEEWETTRLGHLFDFLYGKQLPSHIVGHQNYPVYGTNGPFKTVNSYLFNGESIIVGRKGAIRAIHYAPSDAWVIDTAFYSIQKRPICMKAIYYRMSLIDLSQMDSGSAIPSTNKQELENIRIALPPLREQKAIAEVLSNMDALIQAQKELIAKKRGIKQGTMQDLLSGRVRLPGYETKGWKHTDIGDIPDDWEVKELGAVCKILRGGSPRPIEDYLTSSSSGINWIKIGDVASSSKYITHTEEKITAEGATYSRNVYPGDFLLSNSMSYGRPYILTIEGCIHDGWLVLQEFHRFFESDFLYYELSSAITLKQYNMKAAGSSVHNLNKDLVSDVVVIIPSLSEQQAIAQVLSDMDDELETLEAELEKLNHMKRGMMQELLTGRIRLI